MKTQWIDKRLPLIYWKFPIGCSNSPPLFYAKSAEKCLVGIVSLQCEVLKNLL